MNLHSSSRHSLSLLTTPEDSPDSVELVSPSRLKQWFRLIHGAPNAASRNGDVYRFIHENSSVDASEHTRHLAYEASRLRSEVSRTVASSDGTVKLQIRFPDENQVEAVLLRNITSAAVLRRTVCLSTQVGCAVGCRFCMTGRLGITRNLRAEEILEQFLQVNRRFGPIDNVVFMGMGEPLHNLSAVLSAVRVLCHPHGPGIALSRITISTAGIISGIASLAKRGRISEKINGRPRLAVSLITGLPEVRAALIPTTVAGGRGPHEALQRLRRSLLSYQRETGQDITLEVLLIEGITDSHADAQSVVGFIRGESGIGNPADRSGSPERGDGVALNCNVNLIPWNPVPEIGFKRPSAETTDRYAASLRAAGVAVTVRHPRGLADAAGCGQLGRTITAGARPTRPADTVRI